MHYEIREKGRLLDESGSLREPGWCRSLLLDYSRKHVKAAGWRIKEWDYYLIHNNEMGLALTVADNSYMSMLSVSLLDFTRPWEKTKSFIGAFPMGKLRLPETSVSGVTELNHGAAKLRFEVENGQRKLFCRVSDFLGKKTLHAEIRLFDEPEDSMVIATPFEGDKKAFYYNQKIIGMRAEGTMLFDGVEHKFSPEDSFGLLDWGRGVWTYKNTWYWGAAQGIHDGEVFGFNIGYGFGDVSAASENVLFYKGKAHKFDRLRFGIPKKNGKDDFLSPWKIISNDGRFDMDFLPIIDRASKTDVGLICSDQHQIFGKFTGRAILDDGAVLEIKDLLGFAEKVYNKW